MSFLVYLYYTQPFYWASTFGQNHAYCIQIFMVLTQAWGILADAYHMGSTKTTTWKVNLADPKFTNTDVAVLSFSSSDDKTILK